MLINMLARHSRTAAGLLCIMAKEQQCKEAFLEQSALKVLVDCLSGTSPGTVFGSISRSGGADQEKAHEAYKVASAMFRALLSLCPPCDILLCSVGQSLCS